MKPQLTAERVCSDEACGNTFVAGPYAKWCPGCRWTRRRRRLIYDWTPERDALIRKRYDSHVRGRVSEIARALGYPGWAIKKRAATLGVTRPVDNRRDWTPEEEAFLLEHVGTRLASWMATKLERSEASVVLKLKRMKISRRWREGYTLRDLELCFGTDHHVIDRWIQAEQLIGRRRGTRRTGSGGRGPADPWVFTDSDVLRFIRAHPMAFRLEKVDQLWFMELISLEVGRVLKSCA